MKPVNIPGWEKRVHYFPEIDSTMDTARKLAQDNCPPFTVILADRQTNGRGRLKRSWHSALGGLYFTLVLRPALPPAESGQVNFITSVVLATLLREQYHVEAGIKWPNDILVGGRKIAGMLSEMASVGEKVHYVNIGIGLNINNDPCPVEPTATSLKKLMGRPVNRDRLLGRFLDKMVTALGAHHWEETLSAWRQLTTTLNKKVKIVTIRETIVGLAVDIDSFGNLIVKSADGSTQKVTYGDCFINPRVSADP